MNKKIQITKEILRKIAIGGAVVLAAQSPYFWLNIYRRMLFGQKIPRKRVVDTFYHLKKRGLIYFEKKNKQIYIRLTKEGEKEAKKFQINCLKINPQKKWDRKWRVIIFDIPETARIKREAFRGKLKELNFRPLQKSVWICPYPCQKEIEILRQFFGLNKEQLKMLLVEKIEDEQFLRRRFRLS